MLQIQQSQKSQNIFCMESVGCDTPGVPGYPPEF